MMTDSPATAAPYKLTLVGIGLDGLAGVSLEAQQALHEAEIIYGGARHLEAMRVTDLSEKLRKTAQDQTPCFAAELRLWESPFQKTLDEILELRWQHRIAILATGDPLWYGVGASLARAISAQDLKVFPHLSAFSLAAAAMGWPLQDATCLSCHGRPISQLHRWLAAGRRIIVLTSDGSSPAALAAWLQEIGWGQSEMTVLEQLGPTGPPAQTFRADMCDLTQRFDDLNTVAIRLWPDSQRASQLGACQIHLPDTAFIHDGKITRDVVRTASVAALRPSPHAMLWDVGAGCGSIAIEWLRTEPSARAIAIEPRADRMEMILKNRIALGTESLIPIETIAPEALKKAAEMGPPDAIFIGGGLSTAGVVEACLEALRPGSRLVANAVTLESEAILLSLHQRLGGELLRISVATAHPIGDFTGWRPAMPVTQFRYLHT